MKTKLLSLLLFCFFANFIAAQTLIKTADFTMEKAATILKGKGYTIVEQTDSFVKIKNKENSALFIDIADDKKYLYFNTNIRLKTDANPEKITLLMNEINDLNMIKAKFDKNNKSVLFQYFYWITNSFTEESFLDAVVEFYLYQGDSYGLDKDKIFEYE